MEQHLPVGGVTATNDTVLDDMQSSYIKMDECNHIVRFCTSKSCTFLPNCYV